MSIKDRNTAVSVVGIPFNIKSIELTPPPGQMTKNKWSTMDDPSYMGLRVHTHTMNIHNIARHLTCRPTQYGQFPGGNEIRRGLRLNICKAKEAIVCVCSKPNLLRFNTF